MAAPPSSAGVASRTFIVPRPASLHDDTMGPDTTYITCAIDVDDPNAVADVYPTASPSYTQIGPVYSIVEDVS